jgi:tripartite-type tricarboxylate transporter receptor subunit TctC
MYGKALIIILGTLLVGSMLIQPALGAEFPTKPVEIYIGYVAGNPFDVLSRLIADTAPKYLGQPVVVINKPGAGGSVAAAEVIASKPDGYKLICTTNFFFASTTKTQKIPFDPSHLVPLANLMEYVEGVCVKGDSPFKTLNDLLDYGRKNPGKLTWAHTGRGTMGHIVLLSLFRKAGVETIDIPYKGVPEKSAALLGGHVDASQMTYGNIQDHVKAGKMRFLMVFSDRRYKDLPDVPTAVELGFPEMKKVVVNAGFFIHKDTSEQIKKILFDALKKTYEDPEFKKRIERIGDTPRFEGPEFVMEKIKEGGEIVVPVLKELGLYVGN